MKLQFINFASQGRGLVKLHCDGCDKGEKFHVRLNPKISRDKPVGLDDIPQSGIRSKMMALHWSEVKGKILCQTCQAARRAKPEPQPKADQEIAEMTQPPMFDIKMETSIIVALSAAYDGAAKRYKGDETDRSISELVGDGCRPGWVAMVRNDRFGPEGSEAGDDLLKEVEALGDRIVNDFATIRQEVKKIMQSTVGEARKAIEKDIRAAEASANKFAEEAIDTLVESMNADFISLQAKARSLSSKADKRIR